MALATSASACPSTSMYRSAHPTESGRWSFSAAAGPGAMIDGPQESRLPTGHLELSTRRGLAEDGDAGLKIFLGGIELNGTWRFARGRWSWAAAPYVSGIRSRETAATSNATYVFGGTHLVTTRSLSKNWELSTGPTVGAGWFLPMAGGNAGGVWLGGFANARHRLGSSWALVPEISAYRVVSGDVPVDGSSLQMGLGVSFTP